MSRSLVQIRPWAPFFISRQIIINDSTNIKESEKSHSPPIPFIALAAGLITSTAFPPIGFALSVLIGPALLLRYGRGFGAGFLYGVGLLAPLVFWLFEFNPVVPFAVVLLTSAMYGVVVRAADGNPCLCALGLTAVELLRSRGPSAFPWGVVGSAGADAFMAPLLAVAGILGTSLLIYLFCASLNRKPYYAVTICIVTLAMFGLGSQQLANSTGESVRIGLVQLNLGTDSDYEFRSGAVLEMLTSGTRELASNGADIVVWSETVILEYLNLPGAVRDRVERLAESEGITLIAGAPAKFSERKKRNSVYVFGNAVTGRYDKYHLVPFGEYLPGFGPDYDHIVIPRGTGDFSGSLYPFPVQGMGLLICYEGAFPYLARAQALHGVELFVNISNDAWSKSLVEAQQHGELVAARAIETGRPIVRLGNVGPSYTAMPDGKRAGEIDVGVGNISLSDVPITAGRPLALILGDAPGWAALFLFPLCLTLSALRAQDLK